MTMLSTPGARSSARSRGPRVARAVLLAALASLGMGVTQVHAQSMEERLRTELRNATRLLQQAQSEQAQLKAAKAAAETQRDAAQQEVEQLRAQLGKARGVAESLAEQQDALRDAARAQIAASQEQVGKFKNAYDELLALARATEAKRVSLDASLKTRDEQLLVCEKKNDDMYAAGKELLTAYESFGTADLLKIRQPFSGKARVMFDEQAQQYGDKLYDAKFSRAAVEQPRAAAPSPADGAAPAQ